MALAACWRCVDDQHLQKLIKEEGRPGKCVFCSREQEPAFEAEDFAIALDPVLREQIEPGEIHVYNDDYDDSALLDVQQDGEPLSHFVQEMVGPALNHFVNDIVQYLESSEPYTQGDEAIPETPDPEIFANYVRQRQSERPFFDSLKSYEWVSRVDQRYENEWLTVLENLKHHRRFFSTYAADLFNDLFEGVDGLKAQTQSGKFEEVVRVLRAGSKFYRARTCSSDDMIRAAFEDPYKNVGPPPSGKAVAGRMNPEGVSVLYGALDTETCIAETRPALGNDTVVIKLRTQKKLRLLNFDRLSRSLTQVSYFNPEYQKQEAKGIFLRRLERLISQPIVPGREADYLVTQTLAEYLAYIYEPHFDGILHKSVQRSQGVNLVMFTKGGGLLPFPVSYVEGSITLFKTRSIEYQHQKLDVDHRGQRTWRSRNDQTDRS